MAVLSVLRAAQLGIKCLQTPTIRASLALLPKTGGTLTHLRYGSHGHKMFLGPSRFEYNKWKDDMHFFFMLGLIPMGILIFCVNVFIGPGELSEIPEDYEPRHWEYQKGPIQRWFARYIYDSQEKVYEKTLHCIYEEDQKRRLRILEKKVRALMSERGDYKAWYYVPVSKAGIKSAVQDDQELNDLMGRK